MHRLRWTHTVPIKKMHHPELGRVSKRTTIALGWSGSLYRSDSDHQRDIECGGMGSEEMKGQYVCGALYVP